ncbi:MAG: hypothetical protein NC124_02110 [Clostridium sp.]|nr:hypothetical protein [Clostridium sp.]
MIKKKQAYSRKLFSGGNKYYHATKGWRNYPQGDSFANGYNFLMAFLKRAN